MGTAPVFILMLVVALKFAKGQLDIPTLIPPSNFDPNADAGRLNDALSGLFTDENKIISVLCYRVFKQRSEITSVYNGIYGDLRKDLRRNLMGDFLTLTEMLTYDKSDFLAIEFQSAMYGIGFDEPSMTEILISRTNQELEDMGVAYNNLYGMQLIGAIGNEVSGSLRDLYVLLAQGSRDESNMVDATLVAQDVEAIYDAGAGNSGTDEAVFVDIFASRNWPHLREVSRRYDATYGSLDSVIASEFDAKTGNALQTIRIGTADRDLKRLTVSRCELDLENIKAEYDKIYLRSLSSAVAGDTTGSYQAALLSLIG